MLLILWWIQGHVSRCGLSFAGCLQGDSGEQKISYVIAIQSSPPDACCAFGHRTGKLGRLAGMYIDLPVAGENHALTWLRTAGASSPTRADEGRAGCHGSRLQPGVRGDKSYHATRPFQLALQARAGIDAVVACVRAALALATRQGAVLVSLDGRNAYDSMSRADFLSKLREVAPELLPFVRLFYRSRLWPAGGLEVEQRILGAHCCCRSAVGATKGLPRLYWRLPAASPQTRQSTSASPSPKKLRRK